MTTAPFPAIPEDQSLREVVARLTVDGSKLLRQESELARRELREKVDDLQAKLVQTVISCAVLYAGMLGLLAGVVLVVGLVLPYWLSALAVGTATTLVGAVMFQSARKKDVNLKPEETLSNLRRDAYAVKEAATR